MSLLILIKSKVIYHLYLIDTYIIVETHDVFGIVPSPEPKRLGVWLPLVCCAQSFFSLCTT